MINVVLLLCDCNIIIFFIGGVFVFVLYEIFFLLIIIGVYEIIILGVD